MAEQEKGLIAWFVDNPVAANLLMVSIIILGWFSLNNIRKELMPQPVSEVITVVVPYPSASPLEVQEGITYKVEDALKNIHGIKKITAYSSYGKSKVQVEVDDGFDTEKMVDEIKDAVDAIGSFPKETERWDITSGKFKSLSIQLQLYGDLSEHDAKILAGEVREELLSQTAAKSISISGVRNFEIGIEISGQQLKKYNLTLRDVAQKIRAESVNLPSGVIETRNGFILLRVQGKSYTQHEFEDIVLVTTEQGSVIRLGDIAKVKDDFVEWGGKGYFDGKRSIGITIFAVGNQDTIQLAKEVKAYAEAKQSDLPDGARLAHWLDVTYYLESRLTMMFENMLYGAILVFFVLALFLDLKTAFWVMVGLPVCYLGTFIVMPMEWIDISLNLVSIFGFILVLGIIVDDAIVVGEAVHTEIEKEGFSNSAVVKGAQRVALPAAIGVLTTIVAFIPMIFVEGPWKAAPQAIGIIVTACLAFSLIESKLILPAHLAASEKGLFRFFKSEWQNKLQLRNNEKLQHWVEHSYAPVLKKAVRSRYITLALFIAGLILTLGLFFGGIVKYVLIVGTPDDYGSVKLHMSAGTLESTTEKVRERIVTALYKVNEKYKEEFNDPDGFLAHLYTSNSGPNDGSFNIELTKNENRAINNMDIMRRWRKEVGEVTEANKLHFSAASAGTRNLSFMLASRDQEQLRAASIELMKEVKSYEGLANFSNSVEGGRDEYLLELKPKARALGLTLADISVQVKEAFYGAEAQRIQRDENEIKVMVRYPKESRKSLVDLNQMHIRVSQGRSIPLKEVAYLIPSQSQSQLTRVNYESASFIRARADRAVEDPGKISRTIINEFMPELFKKYPEVSYRADGTALSKEQLESDIEVYFLLALLGVYILLAVPLKSYMQPLIIMSVIPFGVIGAVLGHWMLDYPISMMSLFGIVALSGVVVNDSLIMVDFVNRAKAEGANTLDAVIGSGMKRFRAIMLTTVTTFVGVLPMLLEDSVQAESLIPMAVSLGFGILFATAITLLLVPCLYVILDDVKQLFSKLGNKLA
ncbi:MAG: efflux RND transporter permease subunit [Pseudomonadales bacterium]|nr:efflux RND transporter permease subunit [Pseudomonadales bacterium]